ncbi:MAG: lipopolysaccharide biosynthesis protein [Paludibacter sp.]|nr:lipopolysaccharide biosynthesis protein [Paludibacter sp.]
METSQQNNKRIAKNTLMLYFRMILTMLVSLYTSRVVLNVLGVDDFGTYNVVGGVVTMFGFLNGAMASATQRFLSFELGKNDLIQLRKTFNAAQIVHIGIALLVFVLAETIGLWFLNNYLNIPAGRMEAARWIYHFSVLSFMITIIQVPYNAVIIARERMNVYAYVSILEVILKLLVVFMLSWISFDKLKLYGVLLFVVSFIVAAIYRIYTLRQFAETRFELVKDKALYKTLISYSGWNLFGGVAAISKSQGVSVLLNMFFGTVVNAAQGIAVQISSAINMFVSNFQMASNPQIIKSFAVGDIAYLNNMVVRTSKFSFYLLFILTLPIVIEIDYILKLWLNIVPKYTAIFSILILVNALIDTISGPLMTALQATGKIKLYQFLVGTLLMLILPVTYLLFKLGYPPMSTFFVSISVSLIALALRLILTKKQIPEFSVYLFIKETILRNTPVVALSLVVPLLLLFTIPSDGFRLVYVVLAALISSVSVIYLLGLSKNEKLFVTSMINNFVVRLRK